MSNTKLYATLGSLALFSAGVMLGSGAVFGAGSGTNLLEADKTVQISKKSLQPIELSNGYGGGATIPEPQVPYGVNIYNLSLAETQLYSQSLNYEIVGHSYFNGPWVVPAAAADGMGMGINTARVYNGIAYLGGYPPTTYGVLIADVSDPTNMQPLSFIPCAAGTRCPYLRVDPAHQILVFGNDTNGANPNQPAAGTLAVSGISFYDVSHPSNPKLTSFFPTSPASSTNTDTNRLTHGLDIDGHYAYACAEQAVDKPDATVGSNHEVVILDYSNPANVVKVGDFHVVGQRVGETYAAQDLVNPDGTHQQPYCHEIVYYQNKLYLAYRDAGVIQVDVTDRTNPKQLLRLDYVPPYNGGGLGATHTFTPFGYAEWESVKATAPTPTLAVSSDENFSCPPGFGRVYDISQPAYPQILSTIRVPIADDNYNPLTGTFTCPAGQQTSHHQWFDMHTPTLLHQSWYTQGLRAFDLSNPYEPREVGFYLSPNYYSTAQGEAGRATREDWQDPTTGLIWLTDGNGGGLTALRWTGEYPTSVPIPGAR